jgi:hypothetical protein
METASKSLQAKAYDKKPAIIKTIMMMVKI